MLGDGAVWHRDCLGFANSGIGLSRGLGKTVGEARGVACWGNVIIISVVFLCVAQLSPYYNGHRGNDVESCGVSRRTIKALSMSSYFAVFLSRGIEPILLKPVG
jgi:hypothetical protein